MLYQRDDDDKVGVYLQRLGRCEECAGGNKPGKVNLKSKIHKILLNRSKIFKARSTSNPKYTKYKN